MMRLGLVVSVIGLVAAAACGSDGDALPGPNVQAPAAPSGDNDPAFTINRVQAWYLIGNDLTESENELQVEIAAPAGTSFVDMWIGDMPGIRLSESGGVFRQIVDIGALEAGEYDVLFAANGADTAFAKLSFTRSHPLYVLVSTDWDDPDNTDHVLDLQQKLHDEHPGLKLTHFVGPYTFTAPEVTPERRQVLADWVIDMRDRYGDEIGLHIHPYCNFVDTTSVECKHEPSTVYPEGDETGYTIICDAYSEEDFTVLLEASDEIFMANGLGKPTSFRAGGWTAGHNTLRALHNAGYLVDTSANNWQRMEEWDGFPVGSTLYDWNRMQWSTINDTSQPYYPNVQDIVSDAAPVVPVLEVPDNGILVDYVEGPEMVEIFDANWSGGPLPVPTVYQIGYHPSNFTDFFEAKIDFALDHADQFRASRDAGPVVYATLSEMAVVFPPPQ